MNPGRPRRHEFKVRETRDQERRKTTWRLLPLWQRDVLAPTLLLGSLATICMSAAVLGYYGISAGSFVALLIAFWRQWVYDESGGETRVDERRKIPEPVAKPQRELVPTTIDEGNRSERIGKFGFRESEWRRLAAAVEENDGAITRAVLEDLYRDDGEAKMFPNTTKRYSEYVQEFRRLGWIDDDNQLTGVAVRWLDGRGT